MKEQNYLEFEECLDLVSRGESLDDVLEKYPTISQQARGELEAAQAVFWLGQGTPASQGAEDRSRERFLLAARTARASNPEKYLYSDRSLVRQKRINLALRMSFSLAFVLLLVFVGAFSVISVSASSLPGEPLHPVKLWTENTMLWIERDPLKRMDMVKQFDIRREQEFKTLMEQTRDDASEAVSLTLVGVLSQDSEGGWTVDNVEIRISPETKIVGQLSDGFIVRVDGQLYPEGGILAERIEMRQYEFAGKLELNENGWLIKKIVFSLDDSTVVDGELSPGARVSVILIESGEGEFVARLIRVTKGGGSSDDSASGDDAPGEEKDDGAREGIKSTPQPTREPGDNGGSGEEETPGDGDEKQEREKEDDEGSESESSKKDEKEDASNDASNEGSGNKDSDEDDDDRGGGSEPDDDN